MIIELIDNPPISSIIIATSFPFLPVLLHNHHQNWLTFILGDYDLRMLTAN